MMAGQLRPPLPSLLFLSAAEMESGRTRQRNKANLTLKKLSNRMDRFPWEKVPEQTSRCGLN